MSKVTDLELYAKVTIERGGVWHELQKRGHFALYKTGGQFMYNGRMYIDVEVYRIFEDGKLRFASSDYGATLDQFERWTSGK